MLCVTFVFLTWTSSRFEHFSSSSASLPQGSSHSSSRVVSAALIYIPGERSPEANYHRPCGQTIPACDVTRRGSRTSEDQRAIHMQENGAHTRGDAHHLTVVLIWTLR